MTRVVWTVPALEDVEAARAFVARDSPRYARALVERLLAAAERLAEFPLAGRVVPELGQATIREVLEGSYRLVYRVTADEAQVVAVVHGARQFPAGDVTERP